MKNGFKIFDTDTHPILTFGSDYSHPESRFPNSADIPFTWKTLTQEQLQKLMWDNPVRFFGEP